MTNVPDYKSAVDRVADEHLERVSALDPTESSFWGLPGHEDELTIYSPERNDARNALASETLAALANVVDEGHRDEIARGVITERLSLGLERAAAGDDLRALAPFGSPIQDTALIFTVMERETDKDWAQVAARLELVPVAIEGFTESLRLGLRRGIVAARRQALACAAQARVRSGDEGGGSFFSRIVETYPGDDRILGRRLRAAAIAASASFSAVGRFLTDEYAPRATEQDAFGTDRYELCARYYTGSELDLEETYAWGIEELDRIRAEMRTVANTVLPGARLEEVFAHLERDETRSIEGEDRFLEWNQQLLDETMDALVPTYFDIPAPVRRLEAMIAPPGGAAAMYYTPPTADFSRPGRTWYPTLGRTRFPLWMEPSVAYHEGVPGHHLQIGTITYLGDQLNAFQHFLGATSGYTEGWALYAERLMAELGFLDEPAYHLGMLANQAFRAARVVLDIGLHCGRPVPAGEEGAGNPWTPNRAVAYLMAASGRPVEFCSSEVDRYLGMPGQAISYKVGERVWLETRAAARAELGGAFDLKAFHVAGFNLGYVGLAQLRAELGSGDYARRGPTGQ